MKHAFFLAPAGRGQGLTTVALGLVEALDRRGVRVAFYKPIDEGIEQNPEPERSTHFLRAITTLKPVDPLPLLHVAKLISDGRLDEVMGEVIGSYQNSTKGADMVVVEGLPPSPDDSYRGVLNQELVNALNGEVILVAAMNDGSVAELDDQIEYAANVFGIDILNPVAVRERYIQPLFELRKEKGLSLEMAASQLEDNVVLGTMMLAQGEVDGLVSGAMHSTANTIRPALQIIKTRPNAKVVSSIFFMCLPEQVLVYGDCAVIPDPDVETLADIAIQSADSAAAFGIPPRVAMISYSTGESGSGADVETVREAKKLVKSRRPDLLIDGPLQYDAAFVPDVAKTKAPHSPVAGRATVFIFPDLNTGNTTYKAVQRSANVLSIGPILQGLKRPVNDVSRGALVDDIVYTIALTAVQATQA
jgi:phosphate acetyltransferase